MDSPLILCNDNSKSPNKEGSASAYSKEVGYVSRREKKKKKENNNNNSNNNNKN